MSEGEDFGTAAQRATFQTLYEQPLDRWAFHTTKDPIVRFLRDRRLNLALSKLESMGIGAAQFGDSSVLVVCGGVGGEGKFLANHGARRVTVADLSPNALDVCRKLDARLETLEADSESLNLDDQSFDIVVVQDGLHHLPRPVLGFTEMLRVARQAVIVIEPHTGLAGRFLGREWEQHAAGGATNFVFRWNHNLMSQVAKSYLLQGNYKMASLRLWDHALTMSKIVARLPRKHQLLAARCLYALLNPLKLGGNMFIGIVVKDSEGFISA